MRLEKVQADYQALMASPGGQHLVTWVRAQRNRYLREAQAATDPHTAYALIKSAQAFTVILDHIRVTGGVSNPED